MLAVGTFFEPGSNAQHEADRLGEELARVGANLNAATHVFLTLLRKFEQHGGWHHHGALSCAHWLTWRVGLTPTTASEHVRVAKALGSLPSIDLALSKGELSYCKVRAITRVAKPETEQALLDLARCSTGAQLEKICARYRACVVQGDKGKLEHQVDEDRRYVRHRSLASGMVKIEALLHAEEADIILRALQAAKLDNTNTNANSNSNSSTNADANTPRHANAPAAQGNVSQKPSVEKVTTRPSTEREIIDFLRAIESPSPDLRAANDASHPARGNATNTRDTRDARTSADSRDASNATNTRDTRDASTSADSRDASNATNTRDTRDARTSAVSRDASNSTNTHDASNSTNTHDARNSTNTHDARNSTDTRDARNLTDTPVATDPIDMRDAHNPIDTRDARNSTDTRDTRDPADARDGHDDRDDDDDDFDSDTPPSGSVRWDTAQPASDARSTADALLRIAESFLATPRAERTAGARVHMVVHVDHTALQPNPKSGTRIELEDHTPLSPATARKLACDASVITLIEGPDGQPLSVGRKTRTIPPAIRRALESRDRGCRFPGCSNKLFLDAHHVEHWADGGETSLRNTCLLCRRHHRLVHEEGYSIRLDAEGNLQFFNRSGVNLGLTAKIEPVDPKDFEEIVAKYQGEDHELDPEFGMPLGNLEADYHLAVGAIFSAEEAYRRKHGNRVRLDQ